MAVLQPTTGSTARRAPWSRTSSGSTLLVIGFAAVALTTTGLLLLLLPRAYRPDFPGLQHPPPPSPLMQQQQEREQAARGGPKETGSGRGEEHGGSISSGSGDEPGDRGGEERREGARGKREGGRWRRMGLPGIRKLRLHKAADAYGVAGSGGGVGGVGASRGVSSGDVGEHLEQIIFDPAVAAVEQKIEDRAWEQLQQQQQQQQQQHEQQHQQAMQTGHHHERGQQSSEDTVRWRAEVDEEDAELLSRTGVDEDDLMDPEYIERLDVEERLGRIFPLVDNDPLDGRISLVELSVWELLQWQRSVEHRVEREFERLDKDGDGMLSLKEYLKDDHPDPNQVRAWTEHEAVVQPFMRAQVERFRVLDDDGDGLLRPQQMLELVHPEESEHEAMRHQLRIETVRSGDVDGDGRLTQAEFLDSLWMVVVAGIEQDLGWDEYLAVANGTHGKGGGGGSAGRMKGGDARMAKHQEEGLYTEQEREALGRKKFDELDVDRDGFLTADELTPVMRHVHMSGMDWAEVNARQMMEHADANHDLFLTLDEMRASPEVFYHLDEGDGDEEMEAFSHNEF